MVVGPKSVPFHVLRTARIGDAGGKQLNSSSRSEATPRQAPEKVLSGVDVAQRDAEIWPQANAPHCHPKVRPRLAQKLSHGADYAQLVKASRRHQFPQQRGAGWSQARPLHQSPPPGATRG